MNCLSSLDVARLDPAALPLDIAVHARSCGTCQQRLGSLADARHDLLGVDPEAESLRAAAQIAVRATAYRPVSAPARWWAEWRRLLVYGLGPALAAAIVLVVARPGRQGAADRAASNAVAIDGVPSEGTGIVRAKGHFALAVYCKRGERVFSVHDGDNLLPGDRLRFAYTKEAAGYLTLFAVEDSGKIFPYYPEGTLGTVRVNEGAEVLLPGAVELDEHRGWERIFAVWSTRALDPKQLRAAVGAHGDWRDGKQLELEGEQVSLLVERP